MKDKKTLIIVAVVVALLLIGGIFLMMKKSPASSTANQTSNFDEDVIKLEPSAIGLKIAALSNNHQIKFTLSKAEGITHIEYELSYEADSAGGSSEDGESSGRITRGVAGEDTIDNQSTYTSKALDLGSCSSGTCRYDKGVTGIHLLLKVTKSDDKVYQVEDSLTF